MWLPVAAASTGALGLTLAAEPPTGLDLTRYGIAGVIATVAGVVIRWLYLRATASSDRERSQLLDQMTQLVARHDADRTAWAEFLAVERSRSDRLEAALSDLHERVEGQTMKALEEATRAVSDTIAYLRGSGR